MGFGFSNRSKGGSAQPSVIQSHRSALINKNVREDTPAIDVGGAINGIHAENWKPNALRRMTSRTQCYTCRLGSGLELNSGFKGVLTPSIRRISAICCA